MKTKEQQVNTSFTTKEAEDIFAARLAKILVDHFMGEEKNENEDQIKYPANFMA